MDQPLKIVLLFNNTPVYPVLDNRCMVRLGRLGTVFQPAGSYSDWTPQQIREWLADADAVITSWFSPYLSAEYLDESVSPRLRFIGHAAGTVAPHVDPAAWQRGLMVVSANAAMSGQVAEWAVTLAMMSLRCWPQVRREIYARHGWEKGPNGPDLHSETLCDQTVGLIGFGAVGRWAARYFQAFNCRVLVAAPESAELIESAGAVKVELDRLMRESRVVSLHAPLNEQTRGMIGAGQLALMGDGAVLVNTARGLLIDQDALAAECAAGRLRAALDVTHPEPLPSDHPLWRMDHVILSPHCAGPAPRRRPDFGRMVATDLEAFLTGKPLAGLVTANHARMMTRKMT